MATGWLIYRAPFGTGWQWSAYGPRGGTQGSAASEEEAEMKAQRAMSDLAYPVDPSAVARQHAWKRDEDGDIDIFAADDAPHNGPVCVRCGEGFCHHCNPDCYREVCPAVDLSAGGA
jgi:hypothetical protein